ncbi:hypothetical protein VNI00_012756 [Paramarasmius palmivorus]|uniref:F-box domain-containing protein n=1 Tax=Paramarasmius palmivorus TaxID=297713 RepID=A0AAW0C366_9AGAR
MLAQEMCAKGHVEQTVLCDRCNASVQYPNFPTSYKVRSDYVPTNRDVNEALASIEELKEALRHYDTEVEKIQGVLESLKAGRAQLERQISEQNAILSPLRRVPVEIYHKIFSLVCYADEDPGTFEYALFLERRGLCPALSISLTSSQWRRIAINYPPIWNSISLDICSPRSIQTISITALLGIYLRNAGNSPLKIRVHSSLDPEEWTEDTPHMLMQVRRQGVDCFRALLSHMKRCEILHLDISGHVVVDDFTGAPDLKFSALRVLHNNVRMTDSVDVASTLWFWRAVGEAPLLKRLHGQFSLPPQVDALPYRQLTNMDHWEIDDHDRFLQVLSSARNLESLSFRWEPSDDIVIGASYELSVLQELCIRSSSLPDHPFILFESFRVPQLTTLSIHSTPYSEQTPYVFRSEFMSALRRLSNTLQCLHLNLESICPTNSSMSDIITMLPNLSYYGVRLSCDSSRQDQVPSCISHLLRTLTISGRSSNVVAPKLRRLLLHESHTRVDSRVIDQLLTMIESRSTRGLANAGLATEVAALVSVDFSYWTNRGGRSEYFLPPDELLSDGDRHRLEMLEQDGSVCTLIERWVE